MTKEFLHDRPDFKPLIETAAEAQKINTPALVEKDYWLMHCLYGLQTSGLKFQLKGGTSLSKGFGIIHRFSEDIDIQIEPFDDAKLYPGPNHDEPKHVESRKQFFERLKKKIKIPGITLLANLAFAGYLMNQYVLHEVMGRMQFAGFDRFSPQTISAQVGCLFLVALALHLIIEKPFLILRDRLIR